MKTKKIKTEDFFEAFAEQIKNNPKKLKAFEKEVNKIYRETGDADVIFGALKVLARLKGNVRRLAQQSGVERQSIYNLFKRRSNPTFNNVAAISRNLGAHIYFSFGDAPR
jgi:probable addiction module antidote protein